MEQFSPPSVEQNNDVSHDRAPLIRLIAQLWNSRSTIGHQDLANHQSWHHVNMVGLCNDENHGCQHDSFTYLFSLYKINISVSSQLNGEKLSGVRQVLVSVT